PRSRDLPSPFMPTRSASSPAFSGECQKMRYFGFSDLAGAPRFAGAAGLLCPPASAQAQASKKITSPVRGSAALLRFRDWTRSERSRPVWCGCLTTGGDGEFFHGVFVVRYPLLFQNSGEVKLPSGSGNANMVRHVSGKGGQAGLETLGARV